MLIKKRKIAVGLVAAGAVLGMFLSGRFPGFPGSASSVQSLEKTGQKTAKSGGAGTSETATSGNAALTKQGNSTTANQTTTATTAAQSGSASATTKKTAKPAGPPPEKLVVRVDDYNYQLADASGSAFRDATLRDILSLAKRTTGDDDGLRVRILRRKSARYTAWARLYAELESAGLPSDSISMPKDLVD